MSKVASMDELGMIIIRAQAGDLDAFGTIVQKFQDMAVGYAYTILGDFQLAQDAAQEAFIEAYRDMEKVYDAVAFPAWFRRIVFKYCDRITRQVQPQMIQLDQAVGLPSKAENPLEVVESGEMRQMVLSAIRSLPDEERTVTNLFYIDGYSYNEIASFLEMPATTVDNRLRSARKRLKGKLTAVIKDALHTGQPSKNKEFTSKIQLFNAAEASELDRVRELLNTNAAHKALYDFLKARAEEQGITVEEFVVWVIQQYKNQVESYETRMQVFREKVKSQEKREALRTVEGYYKEAAFHNGAILDIARLILKAEYNIPVIVRAAYLVSKFGYHTTPLVDIGKLAASLDHECEELLDIIDLIVTKLSETGRIVRLAESAAKAKSAEEKEQVKQEIEKIKASADYKSIEEALKAQEERRREEEERRAKILRPKNLH